MKKIRLFRQSEMSTECDQCRAWFDVLRGGVCEECRRILCFQHLHGSWLRYLMVDLGARSLCVRCRKGQPAQSPSSGRAGTRHEAGRG